MIPIIEYLKNMKKFLSQGFFDNSCKKKFKDNILRKNLLLRRDINYEFGAYSAPPKEKPKNIRNVIKFGKAEPMMKIFTKNEVNNRITKPKFIASTRVLITAMFMLIFSLIASVAFYKNYL